MLFGIILTSYQYFVTTKRKVRSEWKIYFSNKFAPLNFLSSVYCKKVCNKLKLLPRNDGVVDSCKALLNNFNVENKEMLKLLLRAF